MSDSATLWTVAHQASLILTQETSPAAGLLVHWIFLPREYLSSPLSFPANWALPALLYDSINPEAMTIIVANVY